MDVTPQLESELKHSAEQLRASGALGKSNALSRLFDYLLERSLANSAPKEIEVALNVFGKSADFDGSSDAVVRVYVHKLRRRLEEHYSRSLGVSRLVIPKGDYRLVLERSATVQVNDASSLVRQFAGAAVLPSLRRRAGSAIAVLCAAILGAIIGVKLTAQAASTHTECYSVGSTART
jgi:hypothetical protein